MNITCALAKAANIAAGLLLLTVVAWSPPSIGQMTVTSALNFDGTGAPCCFSSTAPLTNLYAPLGITFAGVDGSGGSILNQSGGFGFNARSGTDFLAFNTSAGTGNVQSILFNTSVIFFDIHFASSSGGPFSLRVFDSSDSLVVTVNQAVHPSQTWQQIAWNGNDIRRVELIGNGGTYAYDDMRVVPIPEPETYVMLLAGLGVLGFAARRRKLKEGEMSKHFS